MMANRSGNRLHTTQFRMLGPIVGSFAVALLVLSATPARNSEPETSRAGRGLHGDRSAVLVTVNGAALTESQLALYRLVHQIPEPASAPAKENLVSLLVDNELMRQFLTDRRAEVDDKRLAAGVKAVKDRMRRKGVDPDQKLRDLGLNDAAIRREVWVPLAWERHLGRVITQQSLRDEFERHRAEYDGTEVRASQIFLPISNSDAERHAKEALDKLAAIRTEIDSRKLSFAEAARRYSQAPSAADGGDVGFFASHGTMPAQIARVAFGLKVGEISQPFRTPFGAHLYTVTARRPGNLSLEDVRPLVIRRLSREMWDRLVKESRARATINVP
jgi:peptidyl-prolyl cis-trans isomerase C